MSIQNKGPPTGIQAGVTWSVEMDGKSILALLALKPKMTYAEITRIIHIEGGYIDRGGIIHRGTASTVLFSV